MENASKALIIAGAILLAILIITLGILVYRQAAGVVDSNAMDEVAVSTFNEKFQQYAGENVRGTQVNSLISTVKQNNLSNEDDDSKQVEITGDIVLKKDGSTEKDKESAKAGKSYRVTCSADGQSGYITSINVELRTDSN